MICTKINANWLKEHTSDGKCKKTGVKIKQWIRLHSVHEYSQKLAGSGRTIEVTHFFCPACQPDYIPPTMGSPIDEAELVEGY